MKKHLTVLILMFLLGIPYIMNAQCKQFDEKVCKSRLDPYVNYGNFVSTMLNGGEYAELNLSFYSNQDYRISICGLEMVHNLEFRVYDIDHNLIYKNKDHNYSRTWDFKLQESQQLIVAIIVPDIVKKAGCVAIFNGIKSK